MLVAIRNHSITRAAKFSLLIGVMAALASCATKPKPELVSTGADPESTLPWNQQQKWEGQGQLGGMAERLNTR